MKIKKTYHDGSDGGTHELDDLREWYINHGESEGWINTIFSMLEKGQEVSIRFCTLKPLST